MGATFATDDRRFINSIGRVVDLTVTFDTSYTAGGEPITAADAGLQTLASVTVHETVTEGGYVVGYDASAGTLKVYGSGGTADAPLSELAGGTDLSTESVKVSVRGSGVE